MIRLVPARRSCPVFLILGPKATGGGGGSPYNGLYGEASPERGTFFSLQVYKRVGISQVEVYKRVAKSVI